MYICLQKRNMSVMIQKNKESRQLLVKWLTCVAAPVSLRVKIFFTALIKLVPDK